MDVHARDGTAYWSGWWQAFLRIMLLMTLDSLHVPKRMGDRYQLNIAVDLRGSLPTKRGRCQPFSLSAYQIEHFLEKWPQSGCDEITVFVRKGLPISNS